MVEGWMFIGRGVRRFSGWPGFGCIRFLVRANASDFRQNCMSQPDARNNLGRFGDNSKEFKAFRKKN